MTKEEFYELQNKILPILQKYDEKSIDNFINEYDPKAVFGLGSLLNVSPYDHKVTFQTTNYEISVYTQKAFGIKKNTIILNLNDTLKDFYIDKKHLSADYTKLSKILRVISILDGLKRQIKIDKQRKNIINNEF